MKKTVFIHVGTEKTGTTSLQNYFAVNRDALKKRGILFPVSLGETNHINISAYALHDDKCDDVRRFVLQKNNTDLKAFKESLKESLEEEVKGFEGNKIIVSNEHCHSRLKTVGELRELKKLFSGITNNIKIIIYLRRQDKVAASLLSTRIKFGGTDIDNTFPAIIDRLPYYYNYAAILNNYAEVFDADNINVRLFDDVIALKNGLIKDFSRIVGVDCPDCETTGVKNKSLSYLGLVFLAEFNKHIPRYIDGAPNKKRANIVPVVEALCKGSGNLPRRSAAMEFYSHFTLSNEWVRKKYFPNRLELFNSDFSEYDQEIKKDYISQERMVELFAKIWSLIH